MGQAKKKGCYEDRVVNSLKALRAELPETIECKHCRTKLHDILPTQKLSKQFNISHCGLAYCEICDQISVCIGDKDTSKLQQLSQFMMQEEVGSVLRGIYENEKAILSQIS